MGRRMASLSARDDIPVDYSRVINCTVRLILMWQVSSFESKVRLS